ncbi:MAG: hypothetical protein JNL48_13525 [Acidobacteria bacterium]|nr:hypothetical protein [Acidobacteriota bacterium]
MRRPAFAAVLLAAASCAVATSAVAQTTSPDTAAPAAQGLQVQRLRSGFVIAPDAKFTEVNDRQATLVGGYLGWLTDRTLFLGAGGYMLANRDDNFRMQYGGGLARWTFFGDRTLAVSTGLFAGIGDATLARPYGDIFGTPRTLSPNTSLQGGRGRTGGARIGSPSFITADTPIRISEHFVMAEPQLNAVWTITPWLSLDAGVGYRFIGATDLLGDQLRGPSGSVAIRFGGR